MEKGESEEKTAEENKQPDESFTSERRSQREKRSRRSFSPQLEVDRKKKRRASRPFSNTSSNRPCDLLPNGEPFSCQLCKSPYVTNPHAKGVRKMKRSRHVPLPKKRLDSLGREILVCNACSQILDRKLKPKKPSKEISFEERNRYLEDAKMFAKSLAETLNEPDAEKLYCPVSIYKICGCLQRYIKGKDADETALEGRVTELLLLMKKAGKLREEKAYPIPDRIPTQEVGKRKKKHIGFGHGHKKSKAFEEFVLRNRQVLKEGMGLCERGTQRILLYSNNFLHKKLKTEERPCRITRTKGKAALGKLLDIDTLHKQICCIDKCVRLSLTHPNLLKSWRARAISGQMEARKVIAEMLTPAGGYRLNCYQFVSMVTGCSLSTIGKVNNQIRETGGWQDPPVHGMKKVWTDTQRSRVDQASASITSESQTHEPPSGQTQTDTQQEVTSEIQRADQNQVCSSSSVIFQGSQEDFMKIQELVRRQQELQQQQRIVQYQIQQTLGQAGISQNPGWLPQLLGPQNHNIGSFNSAFCPAGNISQTQVPIFIPSVSSLQMDQTSPGQLLPAYNQTSQVTDQSIPVLNQFASYSSQKTPSQFFISSSEGPLEVNPLNLGSDQPQPVSGDSVSSVQLCQSTDKTISQQQNNAELNDENPSLVSPQNSMLGSVNNTTVLSILNQGQFISNVPVSLATHIDPVSKRNQPDVRHLVSETETIQKAEEFSAKPLILHSVESISQHVSTVRQDHLNLSYSDLGSGNSEESNKAAPRMILTIIDPQKGFAQQFELPSTAGDIPLELPANSAPSLTNLTLPGSDQNVSQTEQHELVVNTGNLIEFPNFANHMVHKLQPDTAGNNIAAETDKQPDIEGVGHTNAVSDIQHSNEVTNDNLPVVVVSNLREDSVLENPCEPSTLALQLENEKVTFQCVYDPVTSNKLWTPSVADNVVLLRVVDKSTNTAVDRINDGNVNDSNKLQTSFVRESTDGLTGHELVNNKAETSISHKVMTNSKNVSKVSSLSCTSKDNSSDSDNENIRKRPHINGSGEGRKNDKKQKTRHISREQGFQKLQSKNGKVFLQSLVHNGTESGISSSGHATKNPGIASLPSNTYVLDTVKKVKTDRPKGTETANLPQKKENMAKSLDPKRSRNETHIDENVRTQLRKSLNVPILPKPQSCQQTVARLPVELQPLKSSLFVVPHALQRPQVSQNITSLTHMTKSRVQVQPVLNQNVHTVKPVCLPVTASSPNISESDRQLTQPVDLDTNLMYSDHSCNNERISVQDSEFHISQNSTH